ncbi:hypothetical protein ATE84_4551 [Aquimarina sp. MAR_2010_214]|uniref:hypothetical protein n=1 Tax=Aquimarina sp. MAR_2010_214 TaxID=1250026 RepID=UPI000CC3E75E|nr:hypothetical protein [Aquimarina sp. MAR_2010_214]PKV49577.1 hypothetical protein ATE84_1608 [Aquimarina sp. MAR_2010_214]PKV49584.1 hypothetical protein ATE84_1615 [Aquimarina sp. MAR_2010_214]PKV52429.1 hypothetical protein ATE84_4544 [Aquimarina sp. MAR_2010_214]PKV52436.1 hypothetical protein ATE84_4551 [Aquimarina sp. MAR_2010_214]
MKIELIITDKEELSYLQSSLAVAIHELSASEKNHEDSIYWLSQILLLSYE